MRAIVSFSSERFTPAFGLGNPHLQTLWGPLWRKTTHIERERERLWLADGGHFLDLDWHGPTGEPPVGAGASQADRFVELAVRGRTAKGPDGQGWTSVALNWRGCSGEPNLLPAATTPAPVKTSPKSSITCRPCGRWPPICGRLFAGRQRAAQALWVKPAGQPPALLGCRAACRCRSASISAQTVSAWASHEALSKAFHAEMVAYIHEQTTPFSKGRAHEEADNPGGPWLAGKHAYILGLLAGSPRRCTDSSCQGLLSSCLQPLLSSGRFARRP